METHVLEMERIARQLIVEAGRLIADSIGSIRFADVVAKGPSDFVTEIDRRSEDMILGGIRKHFPDHHILSEESGGEGLQTGFTWVVDPLDGTTNFIHGFPFVAISIAVCDGRTPVLGLVLDPIRGELFTARRGKGAYLNGERIRTHASQKLQEALIATGFPFRSRNVIEPYLEVFRSVFQNGSGIRRAGAAALDLAYLAAGRVDGFWEVGLKPWDVAAGALMVEEAGGIVSDFWGTPDWLLNGHIVGGAPTVYPFLLEQVSRHLAPELSPARVF